MLNSAVPPADPPACTADADWTSMNSGIGPSVPVLLGHIGVRRAEGASSAAGLCGGALRTASGFGRRSG